MVVKLIYCSKCILLFSSAHFELQITGPLLFSVPASFHTKGSIAVGAETSKIATTYIPLCTHSKWFYITDPQGYMCALLEGDALYNDHIFLNVAPCHKQQSWFYNNKSTTLAKCLAMQMHPCFFSSLTCVSKNYLNLQGATNNNSSCSARFIFCAPIQNSRWVPPRDTSKKITTLETT